jgi:glutamate synthase (NADPH/NADH) large chain
MEMSELALIEDKEDEKELYRLISTHYSHTGSPLAKRILDNWSENVERFIKVVPIEYKKVLQEEKLMALDKKRQVTSKAEV